MFLTPCGMASLSSRGAASTRLWPTYQTNVWIKASWATRRSSSSDASPDDFAKTVIREDAEEPRPQKTLKGFLAWKRMGPLDMPDSFARDLIKDVIKVELKERAKTQSAEESRGSSGAEASKKGYRLRKHHVAPRVPIRRVKVPISIKRVNSPTHDSEKPVLYENTRLKPGDLQAIYYRKRLRKGLKTPLGDMAAFRLLPPSPRHRALQLRGLPLETDMAHVRAALDAILPATRSVTAGYPYDVVNSSLRRSEDERSLTATLEFRTAPIALEILGLVENHQMRISGTVAQPSLHEADGLPGPVERLSHPTRLPSWASRDPEIRLHEDQDADPFALLQPAQEEGTSRRVQIVDRTERPVQPRGRRGREVKSTEAQDDDPSKALSE